MRRVLAWEAWTPSQCSRTWPSGPSTRPAASRTASPRSSSTPTRARRTTRSRGCCGTRAAAGSADRFSLPLDPADHGYGHTAEQARSVKIDDAGLLLAYLEAAVAAQTAYLGTLSAEDLDEVIDSSFDPPVTRGARLVSLSEDALQHVGQAAYAQGTLGA